MVTKRGKSLYIYCKPFKTKKIGVRVDVNTAREAKQIEGAILRACRTGCFEGLDPVARETCIRMFTNQDWELPPELAGFLAAKPAEELTLWRATELFLKYPEIHNSPSRWRHEFALAHAAKKFGKDAPVKSIWVPALKQYQIERQQEGAAPDTVNRELGTLSKLFAVLIEMQLVESNPCRLVRRLSAKSGEREVYLSLGTVRAIADRCPLWYKPLLWTAFYTGMRRGEILGLTRQQVNLSKRIVSLTPDVTKERHRKRVPIHKEFVTILQDALEGPALLGGRVFSLQDASGIRELEVETFKNVWPRACDALEMDEPWPRFHDLRATWKTNARRSGMHPEIEMAIMGHSQRGRSVHERYGRISDKELVDAIDSMTFDHGETEIFVAQAKAPKQKGNKRVTKGRTERKKAPLSRDPILMISAS